MDIADEVTVQVQRLGTLVYVHDSSPRNPRTLLDLAQWLHVSPGIAEQIAEELSDEGFLSPLPLGVARFHVPLQLSQAGRGFLQWMQRRSQTSPPPPRARTFPPLVAR